MRSCQSGTGFGRCKSGSATEYFDAHFHEATGHVVRTDFIGRFDVTVFIQVDADDGVAITDIVNVPVDMGDALLAHLHQAITEGENIEKILQRDYFAVTIFQCQFFAGSEPFIA